MFIPQPKMSSISVTHVANIANITAPFPWVSLVLDHSRWPLFGTNPTQKVTLSASILPPTDQCQIPSGLYTVMTTALWKWKVESMRLGTRVLQCSATWFVNRCEGTSMSIPVGRMMMECVVEALVSNTSTILPVVRKKTWFRIGCFGSAVVSSVFLLVPDNDLTPPSRVRRSDLLVCTPSPL